MNENKTIDGNRRYWPTPPYRRKKKAGAFTKALEDVLFRAPVPSDPAEIRRLKNRRRRERQGRI